ncbi:hypothetical protein MBLNU457_6248t2 [Dothideomycetes sp. NU457]
MRSYSFLGGVTTPSTPKTSKLAPPITLSKSKSASQVPTMATAATASPTGAIHSDELLNTIPDPRSPSPSPKPSLSREESNTDLSNEISMLSTKLINAINHSTSLDDNLQHSRHELEAARSRIAQLETEAKEHAESVASGVLLKKAEVDATMAQLRAELQEAKREREASDKAKRQMEMEVENLTSALFEEANTMVADARRENESAEKRNSQLKSQLKDTEMLLASSQEQLIDLKGVMEKMSSERDETETAPYLSTAPSTPGVDTNKMSRILESLPLSPGVSGEPAPDHPLRFSHLITPILRADLPAYTDFAELLKTSRAISNHARSSSATAANSRSVSGASGSMSYPSLPGAFGSSGSGIGSPTTAPTIPALKDSKFYKRSLTEDVEPTLRLDLAPGLSWMARRTVLTSMTAGNLVVEPFATQSKLYGPVYACALCGEDRRQDVYQRRHRFRTSEDASAQRYPLCDWCLGRVRATGDFMGFLRMVRDGLWRAKTDEEVKTAWEESVRLREKMFWARMGGGVIPAILRAEPSPGLEKQKISMDSRKSVDSRLSDEVAGTVKLQIPRRADDPFKSDKQEKRVSIGKKMIERKSLDGAVDIRAAAEAQNGGDSDEDQMTTAQATPKMDDAPFVEEQQQEQKIPGGFDN